MEVINKDHVLATLTDNVPFMMEMVVENGRGYVPATEHSTSDHEIGIIPIDAVYSPVTRVRYEIEETRVGQKTNYDKLTLEIWTNGSVAPRWPWSRRPRFSASTSIRSCSTPSWARSSFARLAAAAASTPRLESKLNMSLAELKLSVRAINCLESENINTVRDLVQRNEDQLLEVRNFGETTLKEVRESSRSSDCTWACDCRARMRHFSRHSAEPDVGDTCRARR